MMEAAIITKSGITVDFADFAMTIPRRSQAGGIVDANLFLALSQIVTASSAPRRREAAFCHGVSVTLNIPRLATSGMVGRRMPTDALCQLHRAGSSDRLHAFGGGYGALATQVTLRRAGSGGRALWVCGRKKAL